MNFKSFYTHKSFDRVRSTGTGTDSVPVIRFFSTRIRYVSVPRISRSLRTRSVSAPMFSKITRSRYVYVAVFSKTTRTRTVPTSVPVIRNSALRHLETYTNNSRFCLEQEH